MQSYHDNLTLQFDDPTTGNAASGALVTVFDTGEATKPDIFDVNGSPIANPLTTDVRGNYSFKVADGTYDVVGRAGTPDETRRDVVTIFDQVNNTSELATLKLMVANNTLAFFMAKMQAGEAVSIALFGDSTTDGLGTTGWVANPTDGNGDAIGNSDQNLVAVNAYPIKLQDLLRDIYSNNNITTFNAGYAGQRIDDGWAVDNYDAAVINNPFYGTPDITVIAFGLNDVQDPGSQLDDYIAQSEILIEQILNDGTLPILMTNDAMYRNGQFADTRSSVESVREIDEAKQFLSKKYDIPVIEMGDALKDWVQTSNDHVWAIEQPDGLHFGDTGHLFKASFIATTMFGDFIYHKTYDQNINTWNSACDWVGDRATIFRRSNNKQGGNALFSSGAPISTDVMTMWVWNESPNANLIYLGIDDEFYATFTVPPKITVEKKIDETSSSKNIISPGGINASFRRSDEHFIFGKLAYGLSKVIYTSGDSDSLFYGGFSLMNGDQSKIYNPLKSTGRLFGSFLADTGTHVMENTARDFDSYAGGFDGDTVTVCITFRADSQGGVLILHGQGFDGTQADLDNNAQNGFMVFRNSANNLVLYNVKWDDTGAVTFSAPLATSAVLPWPSDEFIGRVEISRESGQQRVKVFDAYIDGTEIITVLLAITASVRWSGAVGGLFYNSDTLSADGAVEIKEMLVKRIE